LSRTHSAQLLTLTLLVDSFDRMAGIAEVDEDEEEAARQP
jgi:hypothetical protein